MSQHLRILNLCISGSSARSMSPDPCLSIHMYLRNLCKIHVSDSCLSILSIRFCAPGQAKRKFWPPETRFVWPCAGKAVRPRAVGAFRAGETQILTSGDAFCVALRRENSPTECFAQAKRKFWTTEMNFLWPCAGETQILTSGDASSVQIMWIHEGSRPDERNRHGATARRQKKFPAAVSRRRNANFDLRSCVFCGPAQWKTRRPEICTST